MGLLRLLCRRWVLQFGRGSVRTGRWRWARTKILCKNIESECAATTEKLRWLICPRSCSILAWCTAKVKHGYGESLAKENFLFGEDVLFRVKEFRTTLIWLGKYYRPTEQIARSIVGILPNKGKIGIYNNVKKKGLVLSRASCSNIVAMTSKTSVFCSMPASSVGNFPLKAKICIIFRNLNNYIISTTIATNTTITTTTPNTPTTTTNTITNTITTTTTTNHYYYYYHYYHRPPLPPLPPLLPLLPLLPILPFLPVLPQPPYYQYIFSISL